VNTLTLPNGIAASLAPTMITGTGNSVLTLTASPTLGAGRNFVQVQGTDPTGTVATQVELVVQ